ncbi:Hypothetical protein A7982_11934 [Minicystis rosea]|nr:Hypothetical protein A7982_11934 [Minicystis rosea]
MITSAAVLAACRSEPPVRAARDPAPSPASASATTIPAPSSTPTASAALTTPTVPGPFVRQTPGERTSVDACTYLGGLGFACLDALLDEKDPAKRRYMRRLSDAAARIEIDARKRGEWGGVAHAEISSLCAESGPCKRKNASGDELDDGYACLTLAEAELAGGKRSSISKRAHARACKCDATRAQIPVMGGVLACDGPDKPVERGASLPLDEARDIRACAECDAEQGPKACEREIDRLRSKDLEVARYLETDHVPRCRRE